MPDSVHDGLDLSRGVGANADHSTSLSVTVEDVADQSHRDRVKTRATPTRDVRLFRRRQVQRAT